MDRALLKQNAKNSFKRKYGESIVVALIMGFFSNSAFGYSFGDNGKYSADPEVYYEYSTGNASLEDAFNAIPENFLEIYVGVFIAVITIVSLASIFLAPIFTVGGNRFFLKLRKGVHTGIGEVTGNFKDGNYWNIVKILFFRNIKIFLWTLLFIIPGIVKAYEYMLVDHILAVRPDLDSKTAFNMSKRLMDGYKGEAFILELSFMGWILLGAFFTCGILNLVYVNPYLFATMNEFYCYVRADGIRKGIITPMDLPDYEPPMQNGFEMNNGFGFNPQQQGFNGEFQNQYQQPYQNQYNPQAPYQQGYGQPFNYQFGYQQTPYGQPFGQPQEPVQTPFTQESNQPVGNVEAMPNEQPLAENETKEVEFKPVDENQGLGTGD